MDWDTGTLEGWGDPRSLQVFAQPGLTWHDGEAQVVGLLFLEQVPDGSAEQRDFSTLVTALTRWLLASARIDESTPSSTVVLQAALDDLADSPPTPRQLTSFLRDHLRFHIQAPTEPRQGTVFPFLPGLRLAPGSDTAAVADHNAPDQALGDQADGLAVVFGDGVTRRDRPAGSVLEHILVGYARLLMSNGLQILIDEVGRIERGERTSAALTTMLAEGPTIGRHRSIGSMASRFLLHGATAMTADGSQGVHELLGLQFPLDRTGEGPDSRQLRLSGATDTSLFHFDGQAELVIPIPIDRLTSRSHLPEATPAEVTPALPPPPTPTPSPTHEDRRLHVALRASMPVAGSGTTERLHPLPPTLVDHLQRRPGSTADPLEVDVVRWVDGQPPATENGPGLDGDRYRWATRIDVRVRRVVGADRGEPLADTVEVVGASEADKDLLQEIWPDPADATLRMLATGGTPAVARVLGDIDRAVLVRSNLSTDTDVDPDRFRAGLSDTGPFLQLLWEGLDADTGGFYLAIPDAETVLADTVFGSGAEATITVLIEEAGPSQPNRRHNCLVLGQARDLDADDLLVARSSGTVPVSAMPAGHVAFEVTRASPGNTPGAKPESLASELSALAQLLGWRVISPARLSTDAGPTVGPTLDRAGDGNAIGWRYDRMFPVTGADGDPYEIIGNDAPTAPVKLETWWLDLYGNRFGLPVTTDLPVGYYDDVIGVHQWPSVVAEYEVVTDGGRPAITMRLGFDPSPYLADDPADRLVADRLAADRDRYRAIARQLARPDVEIRLATSLTSGQPAADDAVMDPALLQGLVKRIQAFLDSPTATTTGNPLTVEATVPLTVDVEAKPFVFPVSASLTIARDPELVLASLQGRAQYRSVERSETVLAPRRDALDGDDQLRAFTRRFQDAIGGTRLAVGSMEADRDGSASEPLYAVRLGTGGARYVIDPDQEPMTYALPPLATSVRSATVPRFEGEGWPETALPDQPDLPGWTETRVDNIDLDGLLRSLLVAVERVLDPGLLVPTVGLGNGPAAAVERILAAKARLARSLSRFVRPVLAADELLAAPYDRASAQEAIRQALLGDLVAGYDVETVIQHRVTVQIPPELDQNTAWPDGGRPRVRGKVRILGARTGEDPTDRTEVPLSEIDAVLSAGHVPVAPDPDTTASFTYLFDTKTPERFEALELDLEFVPTDLELEVLPVPGVPSRQSSNFLSFILPEPPGDPEDHGAGPSWTMRQAMGSWSIPIPLRQIPAAPALVEQHVEADDTSRQVLADVRQWEYNALYEHPYVSQDTIHGLLELNVDVGSPPVGSRSAASSEVGLVEVLVIAEQLRPRLFSALSTLETGEGTEPAAIATVLGGFADLLDRVVTGLDSWAIVPRSLDGVDGDLRFDIGEEVAIVDRGPSGVDGDARTVTVDVLGSPRPEIRARLDLPGHATPPDDDPGATEGEPWSFTFTPDGSERTTFGDSSIPDRRLRIDNLDVLRDQNAWASIWLTRNGTLGRRAVDPAFVYRTPTVRFTNLVTPFLTNDEPWDIGAIGGSTDRRRPLVDHLQALFQVLVPQGGPALPPYGARLSCRYAFTMAIGTGLNDDLVTTVPILLGLPVGSSGLDDGYAERLSERIRSWYQDEANRPTIDGASLRFEVDFFAGADQTGLPTLRITDLRLDLVDITDLGF